MEVGTLVYPLQCCRHAPLRLRSGVGNADAHVVERGLYIAATGMLSDIVRQDTIAANLANVTTAGYKTDHVVNETFSDLFLQNVANGQQVGPLNLGTRVAGVQTELGQGPLRATQNPLDLALAGDGFLTVNANGRRLYTRDGELTRNGAGELVTQRNEVVLGIDGQPIVVGDGDPTISSDGRVYDASNRLVGTLDISTLDITTAQKVGDNMWTGTRSGGKPADTTIRQGFVEQSSVNSVKEMVNMITTLRSYESAQRALTAIDGTLDKAVNSVGAIS